MFLIGFLQIFKSNGNDRINLTSFTGMSFSKLQQPSQVFCLLEAHQFLIEMSIYN